MSEGNRREGFRLALLDLDGTLWQGKNAILGANDFVTRLRLRGIRPVFFTNNSTRTADEVVATLEKHHIEADPDEVCTTAQGAAAYLSRQLEPGAPVAYVGKNGLREALCACGLRPFSSSDSEFSRVAESMRGAVLGLDPDATYESLGEFARVVTRLGQFVLTNPDVRLVTERGFAPGTGAIGAFVSCATGITPHVIGKPETAFVEYALDRYGVLASEAFIVGDNVWTDIAAGDQSGVYTIHVQTGVTSHVRLKSEINHKQKNGFEPAADESVSSVAELFIE